MPGQVVQLRVPWQLAKKVEKKAAASNMSPEDLALIYLWHGLLNHERVMKIERQVRDETVSEYTELIPDG